MKQQTEPLKKIMIQLDTKREKSFEEAWGIKPLATVVEEAVGVLSGAHSCGPIYGVGPERTGRVK